MQQRVDELCARHAERTITDTEMRELWEGISTLQRQLLRPIFGASGCGRAQGALLHG